MTGSSTQREQFATADLTQALTLFDNATTWKSYWSSLIKPHIRGRVLEVGAGNGGCIPYLVGNASEWVSLEPDIGFASLLQERIDRGELPPHCRVSQMPLADLDSHEAFDCILYLDVLEHLADDASEATKAASHLSPGGVLIVLSPAHQWLFSPFDEAVGHYRRYDSRSLSAAIPPSLRVVRLFYLDSVGLLLSGLNRTLAKQSLPSQRQIQFWDRCVVPMSRVVDPLLGHKLGKTIVGIWRKAD